MSLAQLRRLARFLFPRQRHKLAKLRDDLAALLGRPRGARQRAAIHQDLRTLTAYLAKETDRV